MSKSTKSTFGLKAALSLSVGMTALVAGGISATAQEEAADETKRLNTVTITATKREQTLQDVPVAVSVVDDQVIEKANIQDLGDLQSLVPSLSVGQLQSSANTNFVIRGFGNGANNAGIEPSVGVFIDGVYRSRSASQISDLPNLQRVEVLRGPQSTLFGKNASAGVISIVTRKPQFEQGGAVEGSFGNFNSYRVKGDITGPLSDTVAYSASAYYNKRDGYADDLATGDDVNQRNRYGLRGQLLFQPNEDLEIRLIGDYDKIDEICCVAGNLINGPTGGAIFALGGALDPANPFSYDVYNNFASENDIDNSGLSAQVDYSMAWADLTSITSYRMSSLTQNADSDFTSADLISVNFNETDIDTFTQEFRLTSNNTEGMFDWMVGAFYFDETVEIENDFQYGSQFRGYADFLAPGGFGAVEGFLGVPIGTTFGQGGQGPREEFGQDNTAWSIFGTLDTHLTDRLTASIGLNYTEDEKDAYGRATNSDAFSALNLDQLGYTAILAGLLGQNGVDITNPASVGPFVQANPALYGALQQGAAAAAQNPAQNPFAPLAGLQFLPPFLNFPNAVENGSTSDDNVSYTLRLAYDASDNLNVYGSYSTGFKATSWNLSRDSSPTVANFTPGNSIVDPVTGQTIVPTPSSPLGDAGLGVVNQGNGTRFAGPEEAKVWELGAKMSFDNFALNVAFFDQTIEGFQSNVFTGTGFELLNAGKQSARGIEWDITANLSDNFTVVFAGTAQDPKYDSFPDSASGDLSGQAPSGIPELSTSVSANYDFTLGDMDGYVRGDWQHEADSNYFDDPVNQAAIEAAGFERGYDLFNASIGLTTSNDISASFWVRNLTQEEFVTTAFPSVAQAGSLSGYPNQPRTYGITLRKEF
ncbi:MAG: TonB-dependent receptor [Henriciella sp.]|nr:TonB-dependent receptor [Henriciella sp.]